MKHIKFKAEVAAPDFQQVSVTILEQTHRGSQFVNNGYAYRHGGYLLESCQYPERMSPGSGVFMRGTSSDSDERTVTLPVAEYAKFKAAVEAYNKEFADPAPKADTCSVVVG